MMMPSVVPIVSKVAVRAGFSDAHEAILPISSAIDVSNGASAVFMSAMACCICTAGSEFRDSI
ncbi:hypothetical protein D3C73_1011090 [compost metagenome]